MLRITNSKGGAAKSYFSKELSRGDYYGQESTVLTHWKGQGAALLGIEGQEVTRKAFDALADNFHPETGEKLTPRIKEDRRAGFDFTFSAPKSVSVLREYLIATGREERAAELTALFREAVHTTMAEIEEHAQVRVRGGNNNAQDGSRVTGNLIWADFTHFESRPVDGYADPHLHAHSFVMNLTHDEEKKGKTGFKALELEDVRREAPYFQEAFHARLAHALQSAGYGVQAGKHGFELEGVERETVEKFSRRTAEVEKKNAEKGGMHEDDKGKLGAKTRLSKDEGLPPEETRQRNMARLSDSERETFERLAAGTGGGDGSPRGMEAGAAVDYAIAHTFERQSTTSERELMAVALKASFGSTTPETVREALSLRESVGLLSRAVDGKTLTTREALAEERAMHRIARAGQGDINSLAAIAQIRKEQTEGIRLPLDATGSRYVHDYRHDWLSGEQKQAVEHVLRSRDRVTAIRGGAGTGKTAMLQEMASAVESITGKAPVMLAPSTTAAHSVLRSEGFTHAETLARFMVDKELQETARGGTIMLDEAGLVGTPTMSRFLSTAKELNARVILQGDTRQHNSVERGDALRLLEASGAVKVAELVQIRRQTDAVYRGAVEHLAKGDVKEGIATLERMGAIREIEDAGERFGAVADAYVKATKAGEAVAVVSPTHGEGEAVTEAIRKQLNAAGSLGESRELTRLKAANYTEAEKGNAAQYCSGQVVTFHQNAKGFKRGERVEVVKAQGGMVWVRTENTPQAGDKGKPDRFSGDASGSSASGEQNLKLLPLGDASRFSVYDRAALEVASRDILRVTANARDSAGGKLNNGSLWRVEGHGEAGTLIVSPLGGGKARTLPEGFGHLTHGYVTTSHASQGRTVDRVLIAQSSGSARAASQEQFYVSASRARHAIEIFTDDKAELKDAVSRSSTRMSAEEVAGGVQQSNVRDSKARRHFREALARAVEHLRDGENHEPAPPKTPEPIKGHWQNHVAQRGLERG